MSAPEEPPDVPRNTPEEELRGHYDSWVEGVPMYHCAVPGIALQVGTNYAGVYGDVLLKISLSSEAVLDARAYRRVLREARRQLVGMVNGNMAENTVGVLSPDEPRTVPQIAPADGWVVAFWMRPATNAAPPGGAAAFDEVDVSAEPRVMTHTHGRAILGLRLNYSPKAVEVVKKALKAERRTEAAGAWMPKPWALWCVWDMRAVAGVLGRIRAGGYRIEWVNRGGFPSAPPIAEIR